MKALLLKYATPFIAGLFLVSLVSGVALFFHVGNATFHGMHEWLSMVLILPFVLHLWKNWKPLFAYLSGAPMAIVESPTATLSESPRVSGLRSEGAFLSLMTATS